MSKYETVGIKALRDRLSSYVERVGLGLVVWITDHGRVVAQLRAVDPAGAALEPPKLPNQISARDFLIAEWVQRNWLVAPINGKPSYAKYLEQSIPKKFKEGTARRLLEEDRR